MQQSIYLVQVVYQYTLYCNKIKVSLKGGDIMNGSTIQETLSSGITAETLAEILAALKDLDDRVKALED